MSEPVGPLTCIGTTNGGPLAVVDGHGGVHALDRAWSIDWWAGADDRWHLAGEEAAVRRRLVDATPVVETAMRIPTGDAVARAYGARVAGVAHDLVAFEVANDTTLPFALALVLRAGVVSVDGATAVLDESVEVRFARPPSRALVAGDVDAARTTVLDGGAAELTGPVQGPVVVLLFPLAHTARLRATLVHTEGVADDGGAGARAETPEADQVARGWRAQLDRGVALRLPDDRVGDAIDLARAEVLLAAAGDLDPATTSELAALLAALAQQGFVDEAWRIVGELLGRQRLNGRFGRGAQGRADTVAVLRSLGALAGTVLSPDLGERVAGPVAKAAHRAAKDDAAPGTAEALHAAADLLLAAHQPEAAAAVLGLPAAVLGLPPTAVRSLDELGLDPAGSDGLVARRVAAPAARLLGAVRPGVVDDTPVAEPTLALFAGFPPSWLGQPIEVHEAPTRFGPVSCAVRWHGARPALLWDIQTPDGRSLPAGLTLRAPALDPTWSSQEARGEALLAEPAPPPEVAGSFS